MHDQLNFLSGEVRSALRFRWIGLAVIWAICLAGWAYVARMPDIYEAKASFFLDTSSLLDPVLENQIVSTDPAAQLAYLRQSLLGREERESVARKVGLDVGIDDPFAYDAMLESLGNSIHFTSGNAAANMQTGASAYQYELSFRHPDREKAIAVVRALVDTFIEGALSEASTDEDNAVDTLDELIASREEALNRDLQAITDFKRENPETQPGSDGAYQARVQNERDALAEAKRNLDSLEARRTLQQQQLERQSQVVPASSGRTPSNSLAAQIREAEAELDELIGRYTEANRVVIDARRRLDALKSRLAAELEASGLDGTDLARLELEANPVYQAAQIALNELELEINAVETEIGQRELNVANLESLMDESLANEATLEQLQREYAEKDEGLRALYDSRLQMELTRQASAADQMDFRPIDEPNASLAPVEPNRLKLILAAFMAAVAAGGLVSYGLSQIRPVFNNAQALRTFAELPVLGTVTNAWPEVEKLEFRRSVLRYSAAVVLLFVAFVGVVALETVGPGIDSILGMG